MGGVKFFTVALDVPEASRELMYHALSGFNKDVDPESEELKGGAKGLGKMMLSYKSDLLAILCHVPNELKAGRGTPIHLFVSLPLTLVLCLCLALTLSSVLSLSL